MGGSFSRGRADRVHDALIGSATADIALHGALDFSVGQDWAFCAADPRPT